MKMIKLTEKHYILVDDKFDPIDSDRKYVHKSGRIWQWDSGMAYVSNNPPQPITHSTQPESFGTGWMQSIQPLFLSEVKELLGVVDVETKAHNWSTRQTTRSTDYWRSMVSTYVEAYNQALEDNKEKKYTYYDIENAFNSGRGYGVPDDIKDFDSFIQSIQPKTEWEVEFVDGKLKLKQ